MKKWFLASVVLQARGHQEHSIRDAQINPDLYYPKEYHPELVESWPSDKPVFIPESKVPERI